MTENKEALRAQIATLEEQIQRIERRETAFADLTAWLEERKLDRDDLGWLYRQLGKTNGTHGPLLAGPDEEPTDEPADEPTDEPHFTKPVVRRRRPAATHPKGGRKGDRAFQVRLAAKRKARGWTPEQLGKRIGVSGSSIRFWEGGRAVPTEKNRAKIVTILGLPPRSGAEATASMEAALAGKA